MMKIGITLDDNQGLEGQVSQHFGQCAYFGLVEIEGNKIKDSQVVPNRAQHGGGGCQGVDELLSHGVTHVIAGGMGMGAQQKFMQAGVSVYGYSGKAREAVDSLLNNVLGGIDACREHGEGGGCH